MIFQQYLLLYQLPVFYFQKEPFGALPGPKTNSMVNLDYFSTTRPILDLIGEALAQEASPKGRGNL